MAEKYVKVFNKGLFTRFEDESIPLGAASDSNNWMTFGDRIELRRGQTLLGTDVSGVGNVSGLIVGRRFDGTQIPFYTYDRKIKYYDASSEDWVEAGTNTLPAAASGEDISMDQYHSLAGAMVYVSSKNSGIYKIPIANPGSVVDQSSTSHRGKIRIKQNRMFLWDRKDAEGGFDTTGLFGSYIDKDELSDYTFVNNENLASGDGSDTTFNGTLAFKGGGAKRTCMYVSITDGTETFRDNRDGGLVGSAGGTGTINYATGEWAVTFAVAPVVGVNNIQADYYWEDATSTGIADFSKSTPRTAGQGFTFRQDDGGADMQNLFTFGENEFSMHTYKTWKLFLSSDDTDATNLIFRDKVGIPYWRAGCATGDGIYYMDAPNTNEEPFVRILQPNSLNTDLKPKSISDQLDLTGYRFDQCVIYEWGLYILVAARTSGATANDTLFAYHKLFKLWDKFDYRVSCMDTYNGALIAGDSASKNVFTLFSNLTDEDVEIPNHWVSGKMDCDTEGVKYANLFVITGLIQIDQSLDVYFSYDNGDFVLAGTINGDGTYVDQGQSISVGSLTLGQAEIGGGGSGIEASPYRREFRINTPRFEKVRVKFVATAVGYVSVSSFGFKDIRKKGRSLPSQYVVN